MRLDVVVWGATGFTGALVAEYLARHAVEGSWALAGRSRDRLAALRDRLAADFPAAADVPLIVADATDPGSLAELASQAKVVCTTVGPYARYGDPLVAVCVEQGAHYCDLTGEPQFMRRTIDRWHDRARDAGLRLVHTCGFDSIPSDLGCFLVQERALEQHGEPMSRVTTYVRELHGGLSGGTLASLIEILDHSGDREIRRIPGDPYALLPDGAPRGPRVRDVRPVTWDADERTWTGSFVMAPTNAKVVRRSNALLDGRYGPQAYEEVAAFRPGARGLARAIAQSAGLGLGLAALRSRRARGVLVGRVLPAPGSGPDRETRERGGFRMEIVGRHATLPEIRVTVRGDRDPGYGATAGMLAESALCLAHDSLPDRFGVLTPATAMGHALVQRLPRAGVTFT